jgi:hypothetical protein
VIVLLRKVRPWGIVNQLAWLMKEDERYELRPLGIVPLGPFDNLEGVAAERRADGRTRLWLVTDNDFSERRRTLLIAVDVPATKK